MKQPRRPFRPLAAGPVRALAAIGSLAVLTAGVSSTLIGRHRAAPDQLSAEPERVAVLDGDTLRLDGQVIRLAGVKAPDGGDHCRGDADCGGAARTVLAGLVRNRQVECRLSGHDRLGRPYGDCRADGTDLSRAIVAAGWARAQPQTPGLADLELRARRQGAGLWAAALPR